MLNAAKKQHVTSVVLDASALLAVLLEERGAAKVEALRASWVISAVNYSEVVATALERGLTLEELTPALLQLPMEIVPFDAEQACLCASFKAVTRPLGLSLGDRACLALGLKRSLPVVTADRAWEPAGVGPQVIQIR